MLPCRCCQWCQIPLVQPPLKKNGRIQDLSGQRIMFRANGKTLKASGDYHQIPDTQSFFLGGMMSANVNPQIWRFSEKKKRLETWHLRKILHGILDFHTNVRRIRQDNLGTRGFFVGFLRGSAGRPHECGMSLMKKLRTFPFEATSRSSMSICIFQGSIQKCHSRKQKKMRNISQTLRNLFCRQKLGGISPMVFVWRIDMVCKH